jgi:hypothetical protein
LIYFTGACISQAEAVAWTSIVSSSTVINFTKKDGQFLQGTFIMISLGSLSAFDNSDSQHFF